MQEPIPDYEATLGPHEVGVMVSIFLFGMVTIQTSTYYQKYSKDAVHLKTLVGFVWTLLLVHTILASYSLYRRTVSKFGQTAHLKEYPEGLCGDFALTCAIAVTVQSFFAYRLRKLSGALIIPYLCWTFSSVRMGGLIWLSVEACRVKDIKQFKVQWMWLIITSLTVSAFVDLMISASLSHYLWIRRRDVFKHAQLVVDSLIIWTIQTGALTSLLSLILLTLSATVKNLAWMAAYLPLSGLFGNYLLASLNARRSLQNDMRPTQTFYDLTSVHLRSPCTEAQSSTIDSGNITSMMFAQNVDEEPDIPNKNHKSLDIELDTFDHS